MWHLFFSLQLKNLLLLSNKFLVISRKLNELSFPSVSKSCFFFIFALHKIKYWCLVKYFRNLNTNLMLVLVVSKVILILIQVLSMGKGPNLRNLAWETKTLKNILLKHLDFNFLLTFNIFIFSEVFVKDQIFFISKWNLITSLKVSACI